MEYFINVIINVLIQTEEYALKHGGWKMNNTNYKVIYNMYLNVFDVGRRACGLRLVGTGCPVPGGGLITWLICTKMLNIFLNTMNIGY